MESILLFLVFASLFLKFHGYARWSAALFFTALIFAAFIFRLHAVDKLNLAF